jgi:hypothetical protein
MIFGEECIGEWDSGVSDLICGEFGVSALLLASFLFMGRNYLGG